MKYVLPIFFAFFCANASSTTVNGTEVKSILVGKYYGDKAFIEIESKPEIPNGHCQSNGTYNYVLDTSTELGRLTLSLVLTAYAAKSSILIDGYDTCDTFGGVEDLKQFQLQ